MTTKYRAWIPQAREWLNDVDLKDLWESGQALVAHGTSRYEAENIQGVHWVFADLLFVEFTGLTDSKGREIYEGDIIRHPSDPQRVCEVVFQQKQGAFLGVDHRTLSLHIIDGILLGSPWEVIGNVYEHPALVTVTPP